MSKIVAVHGSYYANNFGDTLLVKMLCDRAANIVGKENVFLAVEGCESEQKDIGYPVLKKEKRKKATHLLYSGGGYFGEPPGSYLGKVRWSIRNYSRHISWLKDYDRPKVSIIGTGLGPITVRPYKKAVGSLMDKADFVLLRDKESLDYYREYGYSAKNVNTCVDMALSLDRPKTTKKEKLALHVASLKEEEIAVIVHSIFNSGFLQPGRKLDIIFDSKGAYVNKNIKKYMSASAGFFDERKLNFIKYKNVNEMIDVLENYEIVITSKLHVGIVTLTLGGKVISIPAHPKTLRLYNQLGVGEFCVKRDSLKTDLITDLLLNSHQFSPDKRVILDGVASIDTIIKKALL